MNGRLLKLLVELELDKTLLRGTMLKLEGEMVWEDFRYELLPTFCFYCGIIGHSEKGCEHKLEDSKNSQVCEGQFGDWLRKNQNGESKKRDKAQLLVPYNQDAILIQLNRVDVSKGSEIEREGLSENEQLERRKEKQKGNQGENENIKVLANEQKSAKGHKIKSRQGDEKVRVGNSSVDREGQKDNYGKQDVDKGREIERGTARDLDRGRKNETVWRRKLFELDQKRMIRGERVKEENRKAGPGK